MTLPVPVQKYVLIVFELSLIISVILLSYSLSPGIAFNLAWYSSQSASTWEGSAVVILGKYSEQAQELFRSDEFRRILRQLLSGCPTGLITGRISGAKKSQNVFTS